MPRTLRPRLRRRGFLGARLRPHITLYPYPMWLRWCRPMSLLPFIRRRPSWPKRPAGVCYVGGCYHLAGDGVHDGLSRVWVPSCQCSLGPTTR